jgi:hypothetical protein
MKNKFTTALTPDATHVIDDGGCIYYIAGRGYSNDDVAAMFRNNYDGSPGAFAVTSLADDDQTDYAE